MNRQSKEQLEEQLRTILWGKDASNLADAAAGSEDWEVHMQLSPLRQSLLNWYEFRPDACLLEMNAGYGALTGLFCERCRKVTSVTTTLKEAQILKKRCENQKNLRVLCKESGDLQELFQEIQKEDGKYDYVVVLESIEYAKDPAKALREWMQYVRTEGILLVTADNRYGLKYFCGAKDPHTLIPFEGVNGYFPRDTQKREGAPQENERHEEGGKEGQGGRCLSRKELADGIKGAGISRYQFYYPVPDGRMPQMIFSDHYKKGTNTAERLVDYNYEDPAMFGVEHRIFCEMIDSGALPFMANTFLAELTREGDLSDIIYAVTTTDRGKAWGMATTVRNNGLVKKRSLWPEGEMNLFRLHQHTGELSDRGIPVVPTKLEKDSFGAVLCMPYIDEEGLSTVMKRLAVEDPERFIKIFDEIYGYMMASSEKVKAEGVVLEKAYLDLAPCNCFYVKETGSLLFYDQEFALENCPLQFAMFRTLKYSYASAKVMEQAVPLQRMYERYGIDEKKIAEFELREKEFIRQVRNMEAYRHIFRWATPDYRRIGARMNMLADNAEPVVKPAAEPTAKSASETDTKPAAKSAAETDTKLAAEPAAKSAAEPGKAREKEVPYRVGYVPGVFDLFHTGHLNLLERCKSRCAHLIVGVLTDELAEYYKGSKPVISYENRARIIRSLQIVDEVIPVDFSNTDKLDAWNQLHYDCHFSGDDHSRHWEDVREELKKRGSNMEFFPYTRGVSSTQIREKILSENL